MVERKIGEVFTTERGEWVVCSLATSFHGAYSCRGCIFAARGGCDRDSQIGYCSDKRRSDGNSVIFAEIACSNKMLINDIETLQRIAKCYSGKTIEYAIEQLKGKLQENVKSEKSSQ